MRWIKTGILPEQVKKLAAQYGCDLLTASILLRRGIIDGEDIKYFLEEEPRYLHFPYLLPDMDKAVARILKAEREKEKIMVFGDRDVDGITSTVLIASFLAERGMDVQSRIPTGAESYGLSMQAVEDFAKAGGNLIITVDCGISNVAEVQKAHEHGIDVVITDHHNPQEALPDACAIINPKRAGSRYPFRDLAGCGVAYKLVSALRFALKSDLYDKPLCLLNVRPAMGAYSIELAKIQNLAVLDTLYETVVPGMVSFAETRLPAFLAGQEIRVWDGVLQSRLMQKIFGADFQLPLIDSAPEIGRLIPRSAGKSLIRIRELSRLRRYAASSLSELDVFVNLFISAIQKRDDLFSAEDKRDLQLVALGTVADIMPLRNENRILLKTGLESLQEGPRTGLSDLMFKLGLSGRHIAVSDMAWHICPALNAAGRMGQPEKALALLLEKEPAKRDYEAVELLNLNEQRKKLGAEGWDIVAPLIERNMPDYADKLAVAYGENIYRGITGLIASRVTNVFKVPSLIMSFSSNDVIGSARSTRGYDICSLLRQCEDLFIDWGGHDYAAGFKMQRDQAPALLARLKMLAPAIELEESEEERTLSIDAELPLSYLTPALLTLVNRFEPFGAGNEPLNFLARGLVIADILLIGKMETKHVKLSLDTGTYKWPALYWNAASRVKRDFDLGSRVDLVFQLSLNSYNGIETPQMIISDLQLSGQNR
ncbi:MAG: single-stranded-DNA-specific exonuclease RecJ [Spirochaetaceae bacterium]|jgi:single-stranded-DNA-specific exonuclease|nr:single-stranded-DNA-specific exonuclease RecJ [Spirochaetaceae bacterium]